jgi:hypothetical protein
VNEDKAMGQGKEATEISSEVTAGAGYAAAARLLLARLRDRTKEAPLPADSASSGISDSTPSATGPVFSPREQELLKDFSPESLAGLAKVKKAFPGSRVTAVLPPLPPKPPTESDCKCAAVETGLKEKCRVRGALMSELDQIWPTVLKRRRQQRKEKP